MDIPYASEKDQEFRIEFHKDFGKGFSWEVALVICGNGYHTITPEGNCMATCTQSGEMTYICSTCGAIAKSTPVPALGHNPVTAVTPAACMAPGRELTACANCGLVYVDNVLPCTEHAPGAWIDFIPATCTAPGLRVQRCTVCNVDTATVPAHGHTPMEWIVTQKNGCLTPGERVQKCSVCAMTIATETLSALAHIPGLLISNPPPPWMAACPVSAPAAARRI